jgi:hypothetical protein
MTPRVGRCARCWLTSRLAWWLGGQTGGGLQNGEGSFSADGRRLLLPYGLGSTYRGARVWDTETLLASGASQGVVRTWQGSLHMGSIGLSEDGGRVAFAQSSGSGLQRVLRVTDVETGDRVAEFSLGNWGEPLQPGFSGNDDQVTWARPGGECFGLV